ANASDLPAGAGNSSGVNAATLTANVSTVSAGQTAVALTACGTCGPSSAYAYQSAQLTADAVLSEGNKLYSISGSDNLGTSASSSGANVQVDNTGPSLQTVIAATTGTNPQGFVKQGGTYRVYANASDLPAGAGNSSGVNASTLTANVSTVSAGQTAVALTACGTCGPSSAYAYQSAQLTADAVLSEGNKLYSISGSDNLGTSASSSGANVQVDNTGPSLQTVIAATTGTNPQGFVKQGGTYRVYANASDLPAGAGNSSGVNASTLTANVSTVSAGQTAVALTACGTCGPSSAYAYQSAQLTADAVLSEGNKLYSISGSDNLGTSASSSGANVQVDNTGPSLQTVIAATTGTNPQGFVKQGGTYRVYANASDLPAGAGNSSGVNASTLTANVSTVSAGQTAVALTACGTCGPSSAYAYQSAQLTADAVLSEGNKLYSISGSDNLGTSASSSGANVQVDNTGPSLQTVIAATTGTNPQGFVKQGGTYRVYANASDLPAGAGNSSGVNASTLTANVSTVSAGQTAVALTACGTCGPSSAYAYQSAQLTADAVLSEGNKLYSISGSDNLGTSASSSGANVQVDNTGPSLQTVIAATTGTNPQGFVKQGGTYRVYANASDLPAGAGNSSGVNASTLTANVSTVSAGQTAVALTACGTCGPSSAYAYQSAQLTADAVLSEGNKLYSISGSDNLGTSASSSGANVQVDNTGPSLQTVIAATTGTNPQGFVKQGGTYRVYANASDLPAGAGNSSGVNASTLTANVSTVSAGQTAVALTACGTCGPSSAYAYQSAQLTADAVLSEGNKLYSISGSDNLGTSASSSGANVQVDNTGPSLQTVIAATTGTNPQGFVKQGGTYRVYANASDLPAGAGNSSGVNASTLTANVSTVSAGQTAVALTACGTCGPSSAYAYQSAQLTADAVLSEGNKLYSISGADNLGTSASSSGANVQVDNTAPTVAAVIANTTTNEPGWLAQGSGYRVYANVTELPSGSGASSGVNASSITANVSNVTTGQTAVALTTSGCPCSI